MCEIGQSARNRTLSEASLVERHKLTISNKQDQEIYNVAIAQHFWHEKKHVFQLESKSSVL
jgi:hypothetical protein